ncbi:unnamed protein product, partial [marine sediment metagenome]
MEYYWQIVGTQHGWICSGSRTQCLPIQYGNKRYSGSGGEYGGIERYVRCGWPGPFVKNHIYECKRKEIVQEEEPWPPEEACRLRDHFDLLWKLEGIMDSLKEINKKVGKIDVDLEATNAQIESGCESIKQDLENVKNKIDEIKPKLIDFGVSEADIGEAKTEIDEVKPKIDELEGRDKPCPRHILLILHMLSWL